MCAEQVAAAGISARKAVAGSRTFVRQYEEQNTVNTIQASAVRTHYITGDPMQAIMYHYVRPETDRPPAGYYHLPLDRFRAQLDYLSEEHTLLSKSMFLDCLRGRKQPPDDGVVLTFDDGLIDHYKWVKPELEARDHWGLFFISTAPLVSERRLIVHRVHTLVSLYPGDELLTALVEILQNTDGYSTATELAQEDSMYAGRNTDESVRSFKRLLNQEVPYEVVPDVLNELEDQFPKAGAVDTEDLYISKQQLRELSDAGMLIGAHSVSHRILSRLSTEEQRTEIRASQRQLADILDDHIDTDIDLFAYPYGGESTFTEQTVDLLRSADCTAAFTTESGTISAADIRDSRMTLSRRDCTEIKHGESDASLPD